MWRGDEEWAKNTRVEKYIQIEENLFVFLMKSFLKSGNYRKVIIKVSNYFESSKAIIRTSNSSQHSR